MEGKRPYDSEKIPNMEFLDKSSFKIGIKEEPGVSSNESLWSEYLAARSSAATPDIAFAHVERSLSSDIQPGQLLEIICERKLPSWYITDVDLYKTPCIVNKSDGTSETSPSMQDLYSTRENERSFDSGCNSLGYKTVMTYWIAKVVSACGPLLSIEYVLPHTHVSEHSWVLIGSDSVAGVGHGDKEGYVPAPPLDVVTALSVDKNHDSTRKSGNSGSESYQAVVKLLSFLHASTSGPPWVDKSALQKETLPSCKRLKSGGYVEVLACASGKFGWPASIEQNVGGRLQLKFVELDITPVQTAAIKSECGVEEKIKQEIMGVNTKHMFWLFCTDHRLRNLGWIDQRAHDGYRYVCPLSGRSLVKLPHALNSKFQTENLLLVPTILPLSCADDESEQCDNSHKEKCRKANLEEATEISTKCAIDDASNLVENNALSSAMTTDREKCEEAQKGTKADSAVSFASKNAVNCTTFLSSNEELSNKLIEETAKGNNASTSSKIVGSSDTSDFVREPAIDKNSDIIAVDVEVRSNGSKVTAPKEVVESMVCSSKSCNEKPLDEKQVFDPVSQLDEVDAKVECLKNILSSTQSDATEMTHVLKGKDNCDNHNLENLNVAISDLNKGVCLVEKRVGNLTHAKTEEGILDERPNVPSDGSDGPKVKRAKIEISPDNENCNLRNFENEEEGFDSGKQVASKEAQAVCDVQECNILPVQSTLKQKPVSEIVTPVISAHGINEDVCCTNPEFSNENVCDSLSETNLANCTTDGTCAQTDDIVDEIESNGKMCDENILKVAHAEKMFDWTKELDNKRKTECSSVDTKNIENCCSTKALDFDDKIIDGRVLLHHGLSTAKETISKNVLKNPANVHSHQLQQSDATAGRLQVKETPNICDELHAEGKIKNLGKCDSKNFEVGQIEFLQKGGIKLDASQFGNDTTKNHCGSGCVANADFGVKNLSTNSVSENNDHSTEQVKTSLLTTTSSGENEFCNTLKNTITHHQYVQDEEKFKIVGSESQTPKSLKAGMVLEVVNPEKLSCVHAAIVSDVSRDGLVEVMFSSCSQRTVKSELTCKVCKVDVKGKNEVMKTESLDTYDESRSSCSNGLGPQPAEGNLSNIKGNQPSTFNSHIVNSQKYSAYFGDLVLLPAGFCDEYGIVLHPILVNDTIIKSDTICSNCDSRINSTDNGPLVKSISSQESLHSFIPTDSEEHGIDSSIERNKRMSPIPCTITCVSENASEFSIARQSLPISVERSGSQMSSLLTAVTPGVAENSEHDLKQHSDAISCVHNIQDIDDIQKTSCISKEKSENTETSSILKSSSKNKSRNEVKVLDRSEHHDVSDYIDIDVEIVDDVLESSISPLKEHREVSSLPIDSSSVDKLRDESSDATVVGESGVSEEFCYGSIKSFSWTTFLKENPAYERTPPCVFPAFPSAMEAGFSAGQKLEVVHPEAPDTICAATVAATTEHLLWLKIDSLPSSTSSTIKSETTDSISSKVLGKHCSINTKNTLDSETSNRNVLHVKHIFCDCKKPNCVVIKPSSSDEIFPVGWAHSNKAKFLFPQSIASDEVSAIQTRKFCPSAAVLPDSPTLSPIGTLAPSNKSPESNSACESRRHVSKESSSEPLEPAARSRWCPSVYLNHSCCPGPHLSRSKLASQVGVAVEGSVGSVVRQIVSQSLAAGFCQARLSKDLTSALQDVSKDRPHWHLVDVKAKSKRFSVRGSVMCPQFRDEVPIFLQRFIEVLQCCPNLWSFTKQPDCPHRCIKAVSIPVSSNVGRVKRSRLDSLLASTSLLANTNLDLDEDIEEEDDEWEAKESTAPIETGEKTSSDTAVNNGSEATKVTRKLRTETPSVTAASASDGADAADQPPFKKRKLNRSYAIPPARVTSDPLSWSVNDVFDYVSNEATISHHATWLRNEKIDGKALMLLNLSTLVNQLQLPHVAVLPLAHHLCRLKMAHLLLREGEC